jgi:hypothetical protein
MRHTFLIFLILLAAHPLAAAPRSYKWDALNTLSIGEKFVRTELYFGTNKPAGGKVSEAEWQAFVDEEITARFPDGLTILNADGQWRGKDGSITREKSKVLVLFYPRKDRRPVHTKIEEIRSEYKIRFQQESVIRIDMTKSLTVSF